VLPTTAPAGSTNRRFYSGPIGVAGVGVVQDFDISQMPLAVRQDPTFVDNWIVFARQVDPGITNVETEVTFLPAAPALPTTLRLTLDAAAVTDEIDVEFWYIHSITR
jgi:hypothetical protein